MSRKGKIPVVLSKAVKADVSDNNVVISGPNGTLRKTFDSSVVVKLVGDSLVVSPVGEDHLSKSMFGTARSILQNMVAGVVTPFFKDLEIQGVGFKATMTGRVIDLALGYSHPLKYSLPDGISVAIKDGTKLRVEGADKHLVGQVAADIKSYYPVEPYKGKGVRIIGEFIRRKEGKKKA